MKYLNIFALILSAALLASCSKEISEKQSESFLKMLGSYGTDLATGVAVLDDGGYAICGTSVSPDSGSKMVLLVTDKFGNLKQGFPKYYPHGNLNTGANAIVAKNRGLNGFLLSGYVEDESGDRDIFIVKTSPTGNVSWSRSYGSVEDEEVLHATEGIETAEFMLAGYQEKNGVKDIMVMGVDQNGDSIRLSLLYTKPPDSKDASANYILNTGDDYMCICTYNKKSDTDTDMMLLTFDQELSPIVELITGQFDEVGKCIVQQDQDSYVIVGNSDNTLSGRREIVLYLIQTSGISVRESSKLETITDPLADLYAEKIVDQGGGRYALVGTRELDGDEDIYIQFFENGVLSSGIVLGSTGNQKGADIAVPADGGLIIVGNTSHEENSMITLIKTDDSGNF